MAGQRKRSAPASAGASRTKHKPTPATKLFRGFVEETRGIPRWEQDLAVSPSFCKIRDGDKALHYAVLTVALAGDVPFDQFFDEDGTIKREVRVAALAPRRSSAEELWQRGILLHNRLTLVGWLLKQDLPLGPHDVDGMAEAIVSRKAWEQYFDPFVVAIRSVARTQPLSSATWSLLSQVRVIAAYEIEENGSSAACEEVEVLFREHRPDLAAEPVPPKPRPIEELVGLSKSDAWAALAIQEIRGPHEAGLIELVRHAATARTTNPTAKWQKEAAAIADRLGQKVVTDHLIRWMSHVDRPRKDKSLRLDESNTIVLKGLCWFAAPIETPEMARALGGLVRAAFRKAPLVGPRGLLAANAAMSVLAMQSTAAAAGQLALLKTALTDPLPQKAAAKALAGVAARLGVPPEEIEELGIPTHGLDADRVRQETFGTATVRLSLDPDGKCQLAWFGPDEKPLDGPPPAIRKRFGKEIRRLTADAEEIEALVAAQRVRIEQLYLEPRSWTVEAWRETYLDHPIVGLVARRLIWRFVSGSGRSQRTASGIWRNRKLVGLDGQPLSLVDQPGTTVALWHPVDVPVAEVLAWREWLERHELRQPFKQAHREVYLLTPAEKKTRTYSNRFAGHVIRRGQFQALCRVRGWRAPVTSIYDEIPPATKALSRWHLRAEFEIAGIRGNFQRNDDDEATGLVYLSTDQVHFVAAPPARRGAKTAAADPPGPNRAAGTAVPLREIPPILFSEVLRDLDLFIGVAGIGNDPTWSDRGPERRFREYWESTSFGELSETARTRGAVLERLLPKLAIGPRCTIDGRFLKVRGDLRTYRIHLGSGNILMEPNDQYLCIVPDRHAELSPMRKGVFLPFDGDRTLSIILSKAHLLAADQKIKDPSILEQIGRKG